MATLINKKSVTVMLGGRVETIADSDKRFGKVLRMLKKGKSEKKVLSFLDSTDVKTQISLLTGFRIENGVLERESSQPYGGSPFGDLCEIVWNPVDPALSKRVLWMVEEGIDPNPVLRFYRNLERNPSFKSRRDLLRFLDSNRLPLTADGFFMAYKRVTEDFKDLHTGTLDNSVGRFVSMDRSEVDDDSNNTCSAGLHVCSLSYLKSFSGARLIAVKVNPADVVSVPKDYDNSKMRVCKYEVTEELPMSLVEGDRDYWDSAVA